MLHEELKEIFLAEALEGHEELNRLFTKLEKSKADKESIDAIFRITHTLKANAAGMGYDDIADLAHILEDVFSESRSGNLIIDDKLFADLYKAIDAFGALINKVKDPDAPVVKFKGLKTKLEVVLRKTRLGPDAIPEDKNLKSQEQIVQAQDSIQNAATNSDFSSSIEEETEDDEENEDEVIVSSKVAFSDLIQIPVRKLDALMNLVGELIIERDRISNLYTQQNTRNSELSRLQRITSDIQYSVMDVRLVQVNVLFNKFHRIVRDTAAIENKKVNLILEGTENEIDRNVLQIISDSLIHLVRNAISHGIESQEERIKKNKPSEGEVRICAHNEKDIVIIEVKDDGRGIDENIILRKAIEKEIITAEHAKLLNKDEIIHLIFEPGFSSVETITEVSGRGVGMDVVKKAIDSIGGKVYISTEVGHGSTFSLHLPSSMALKGALMFELGTDTYALPLSYTDAVIHINKNTIHKAGKGLVTTHLDKTISVVFLSDLLEMKYEGEIYEDNFLQKSLQKDLPEKLYLIVVSYGSKEVGFVVDRPLQQKEIVEKPLAAPLETLKFISGATILGNGKVCLVLDVASIVGSLYKNSRK